MKINIQKPPVGFVETIWEGLKTTGKVRIHGLGTFELKEIAGRKTYNPVTKGEAYMKPYLKIKFRPYTGLQEYINE